MGERVVAVRFGALAPVIGHQFPELDPSVAKEFDEAAFAITMLHLRGLLSDGETRRARKRLTNDIVRALATSPASALPAADARASRGD